MVRGDRTGNSSTRLGGVANIQRVEVRIPLPEDTSSAARTRAAVREALSGWGLSELEPVASLVATELVTNAVIHSDSGPTQLLLSLDNTRLRIEVSDGDSTRLPRRLHREVTAEGGRGLALVDALSSAWGTMRPRIGDGKTVWCELVLSQQ
jgi:anti-sigma regulatory factor (Ser/Thr protein kinase)